MVFCGCSVQQIEECRSSIFSLIFDDQMLGVLATESQHKSMSVNMAIAEKGTCGGTSRK